MLSQNTDIVKYLLAQAKREKYELSTLDVQLIHSINKYTKESGIDLEVLFSDLQYGVISFKPFVSKKNPDLYYALLLLLPRVETVRALFDAIEQNIEQCGVVPDHAKCRTVAICDVTGVSAAVVNTDKVIEKVNTFSVDRRSGITTIILLKAKFEMTLLATLKEVFDKNISALEIVPVNNSEEAGVELSKCLSK